MLRSPLFGFTDDDLAHLYDPESTFWEESKKSDGRLGDAANRIRDWRASCGVDDSKRTMKWGALISRVIDETGYLVSVGADERPQQAVVNVNQFRESLRTWEEGGALPLSDVLSRIKRERSFDTDVGEAEIPTGVKGVQLRTVHSAKGLEFPIVLIPELGRTAGGFATVTHDDGRFPHDLAYLEEVDGEPVLGIKGPDPNDPLETTKTPDWISAEAVQEREERAEAKRVLYVAATRVRDHLLLSSTHEFDDEAEAAFGPYKSSDGADRWRDWVQPILLEDHDLLSDLRITGSVQRNLPNSTYTVRRPLDPVAGPGAEVKNGQDHNIEVPFPSLSLSKIDMSATDFRDLVAENEGGDEGNYGPTTGNVDTFLDTLEQGTGLGSQEFGTVVHRLCELSLTGVDVDWDIHPSRIVDDPICLTSEEVTRIREHVDVGVHSVQELEQRLDIKGTHDEVQVALNLSTGRIVGNIDHLTVTDNRYYVTDYKTDSLVGRNIDELAGHYWPQLRVYACALQQASPKVEVVLRLVFTENNRVRTETCRKRRDQSLSSTVH